MCNNNFPTDIPLGPNSAITPIIYSSATCRGSIHLKTGCGKCERCKDELARMYLANKILEITHAQLLDWAETKSKVFVFKNGSRMVFPSICVTSTGGLLIGGQSITECVGVTSSFFSDDSSITKFTVKL